MHIFGFVILVLMLAGFNLIAALCGRILLSKKFEAPSRDEAKTERIIYLAFCVIVLLISMITGRFFSLHEKLMMLLPMPLFWELLYFSKMRKRYQEAEQTPQ